MPLTLDIRLARFDDLALVDALFARSYARLLKDEYPPSVQVTALPRLNRAKPELLRSGRYFLAEEDDQIVGAGGWSLDPRLHRLGHVRHLVTDHRLIRRGIATRILNAALAQARKEGVTRMACDATRLAVPFYESRGFFSVGPVEVNLAPGISFPAVRMARAL